MGLVAIVALVSGLVIGAPLVLVALTAVGPAGWIVAAIVAPLAALAGLVVAARPRGVEGSDAADVDLR